MSIPETQLFHCACPVDATGHEVARRYVRQDAPGLNARDRSIVPRDSAGIGEKIGIDSRHLAAVVHVQG